MKRTFFSRSAFFQVLRPPLSVRSPRRCRGAAALVTTLIISLVLLGAAFTILELANTQTTGRGRYEVYKNEFAAAEEALNKGYGHFQFLVGNRSATFAADVQAMTAPAVSGIEYTKFTATQTGEGDVVDQYGTPSHDVHYRIDVTAKQTTDTGKRYNHPGVSLSQNLDIKYIPIPTYLAFYDPVMEIAPGAPMVVNGRVHANGDAYIQSGAGLDFQQRVMVAGSLYHGRAPASGQTTDNGNVTFFDGTSQVTMKRSDADGWLDHRDSDWATAAIDSWNSYVRDEAQGAPQITLPIPSSENPHVLIERTSAGDSSAVAAEKFENKAGLKIMSDSSGNVTAKDKNGVDKTAWLTYHMEGTTPVAGAKTGYTTKYVVTANTFYDQREAKTVTTLDVNIANLSESGVSPSNGILYVTNENQSGKMGVVRLTNGSDLPNNAGVDGFTVASDDPVYVKGDYNTVNDTLALVAGDAINILSNAWNDANSASSLSNRVASATTVNCVFINGIVPTANNNYSGGVENYFRLLENWSGKTYTFHGSLIELWLSQKATGKWPGTGTVYNPPTRIWSWDTALGGMIGPPGLSPGIQIQRKQWSQGSGS